MKKSSIVEKGTLLTIFVNFREIFRLLTVDCRVSLSLVVDSSWLSSLGCRFLAVDSQCRLSFTFFTQRLYTTVVLYCTLYRFIRFYCIFT
jgi:hypothetical protein